MAPALLALFAGAGGIAVELVWMRLLSLAFGSASLAAGSVVAAIMLGMALGSAGASRIGGLGRALFALAVGAVASPPILAALSAPGLVGILSSAMFMTLASIPMGMVVPLLIAGEEAPDTKAAGRLYAWNTAGSAVGVLVTGFMLLPALGNRHTLWVAAGLLALLGLFSLRRRKEQASLPTVGETGFTAREGWILAACALSAFAAMVSEIAWMRALVLSIGSSTYAYTLVLGVYIGGLGLGSALAARRIGGPGTFGALQLALAVACLATFQLLGRLPDLFGRLLADRVGSLSTFVAVALPTCAVTLLPATILIGACFPVALGWLGGGTARRSGALLAAATGASMAGALAGSFVLIPLARVEFTLVIAIVLHAVLGSWVLSAARRNVRPSFAAAAIVLLVFLLPRWDARVLQSGPYLYGAESESRKKVLFAQDDPVASVAVFALPDGNRILRIDGKTDASMSRTDLVTQLLTAHIPLSLHRRPDRVVLVGLGSGMTLASCLKHRPQILDCVEISPAVARASRLFDGFTGKPLDDPRVRLHVGDARDVFRKFNDKFDVIISEPSNLWIAGMAGLFTEEFYRTCEARLADGGLMAQWVHAYGILEGPFRDAVATFLKVFPYVTLWEMWVAGDYLMVGSPQPYVVDVDVLRARIAGAEIAADLRRIGVENAEGLLGDLVAQGDDLADFTKGARIQTDDGLHLEFSAPLGFYGRRRLPAVDVLPPVDAARLERVVQGRRVTWAEARALVRDGVRAISEGGSRDEVLRIFRAALERFPADRQARFLYEDQAGRRSGK